MREVEGAPPLLPSVRRARPRDRTSPTRAAPKRRNPPIRTRCSKSAGAVAAKVVASGGSSRRDGKRRRCLGTRPSRTARPVLRRTVRRGGNAHGRAVGLYGVRLHLGERHVLACETRVKVVGPFDRVPECLPGLPRRVLAPRHSRPDSTVSTRTRSTFRPVTSETWVARAPLPVAPSRVAPAAAGWPETGKGP